MKPTCLDVLAEHLTDLRGLNVALHLEHETQRHVDLSPGYLGNPDWIATPTAVGYIGATEVPA